MENCLYRGLNSREEKKRTLIPHGNANLYSGRYGDGLFLINSSNFSHNKGEAIRHQYFNHGPIFRDQVQEANCDWNNFYEIMIQNDWAKPKNQTEIMLKVNINDNLDDNLNDKRIKEKLKKRMTKVFGENFDKIYPILRQSVHTAGVSTSKLFDIAVKFATCKGTKDGSVAVISREKLLKYQIAEHDAEILGSYEKQGDREVILYAKRGSFYFPKEIIIRFKKVKARDYNCKITTVDLMAHAFVIGA